MSWSVFMDGPAWRESLCRCLVDSCLHRMPDGLVTRIHEDENDADGAFSSHTQRVEKSELGETSASTTSCVHNGKRWFVLLAFSVLTLSSAWIWITWSPLSSQMAHYWDVSEAQVDDLSGVYLYVYIPCSFLSLWLANVLGLRYGFIAGATLNAVGAWVRWQWTNDYSCVYVGTLLCAVAQTFTLAAPPLVADNWFGAHERATATAVGVSANLAGVAVGLSVTILVEFCDGAPTDGALVDYESHIFDTDVLNVSRVYYYVATQFAGSVLAWLLVTTIVSSDRPPKLPSAMADLQIYHHQHTSVDNETNDAEQSVATETTSLILAESGGPFANASHGTWEQLQEREAQKRMTYWESVETTLSTQTLSFIPVFGLAIGVYYTIPTFLSQLTPSNWTTRTNGWLGLTYVVSGLVGTFVTGRVLDHNPTGHWVIYRGLLIGALLSWLVVSLLSIATVSCEATWPLHFLHVVGIFAASCITGFCLAAMIAVGMEYGATMSYPADPAATAGILECAAEGIGFILVRIGAGLMPSVEEFHALLLGTLAMSLFWMLARQILDSESDLPDPSALRSMLLIHQRRTTSNSHW